MGLFLHKRCVRRFNTRKAFEIDRLKIKKINSETSVSKDGVMWPRKLTKEINDVYCLGC